MGNDWLKEELYAWNLKGKSKEMGSCASRALLWHLSKERNARGFDDKPLRLDFFCNYVQNMFSGWISLYIFLTT